MKKTVIELFAGVGGFRVGLNNVKFENNKVIEDNNWDFVWANQWEPGSKTQYAFNCYIERFGHRDNHCNEDINKVIKSEIPDHNLLVGGFPCQDYSVARSLKGEKGIQGKKGVLFWDIMETINAKHPPFVLLENVDRLLKSPSKQRGRDFGIMLRSLNDAGYNVEWRIINAAEYGFAQRRRRVYIFAWSKTTEYNNRISKFSSEEILLSEGLNAKAFPVLENGYKYKTIDVSVNEYLDTVEMTEKFSANFEKAGVCINGITTTVKMNEKIKEAIKFINIIDVDAEEKFNLNDNQISKFEYLKGSKKVERKRSDGGIYFFAEGGMDFPDSLDKPGRTMLTSEGSINRSTHVIEDPKTRKLRFITPIEAERLQGFPDNWTNTMPNRSRYFMMGNALVTNVIATYGKELNQIFDSEK